MNTPNGIDSQMISNPPYYVQGRKIQPIDVIEGWSFCHHLGCVVKYVARLGRKSAGRQNPILEDLKKAEWYLMREIAEKSCLYMPRLRRFPMMPEAIAKDWQLSSSLKEVIFYLTTYQRLFCRFPLTKTICLKQALTHLRVEIKNQESEASNQNQQPTVLGANVIIFKDTRVKDVCTRGRNPCSD